jgi:hypothetical protein
MIIREEPTFDLFNFEDPPELFSPISQRLHDLREEEDQEVVMAEKKESPLVTNNHDYDFSWLLDGEYYINLHRDRSRLRRFKLGLLLIIIKYLCNCCAASESPPVNWDELRSKYGGNTDDGLCLSDLIDYDQEAAAADKEETNCPGT